MKKMLKIIKLLFILILLLFILWFFINLIFKGINQAKINKAIPLVLAETNDISVQKTRGCIYDRDTVIVSLDGRYYFSVKKNQVKLLEIMHHQQDNILPDLERDEDFMDIYWLLENCK